MGEAENGSDRRLCMSRINTVNSSGWYYCHGCALVTLQYRSEISEPPNTEFGKFVRIVPFPGPFSRF